MVDEKKTKKRTDMKPGALLCPLPAALASVEKPRL